MRVNSLIQIALAAVICMEAGYMARGQVLRAQADLTNVLIANHHEDRLVLTALLVLGESDCTSDLSGLDLLETSPFQSIRLRTLVLVHGPDSIRNRTETLVRTRGIAARVHSVTSAQLRTLGLRPNKVLGKLILLDQRRQPILLTSLPKTSREYVELAQLASHVAASAQQP